MQCYRWNAIDAMWWMQFNKCNTINAMRQIQCNKLGWAEPHSIFLLILKKHFRSNKMLVLNKCRVQKKLSPEYFCVQQNVGCNKLWVHKYFEPKQMLGPTNFWVQQIFKSKNTLGPTKYWVQQIVGSEQKVWSQKVFGSQKGRVPKCFESSKFWD